MVTIDGSFGEGGGQILRTALTLSLITGKPFRIVHIRANRKRPGLLRQHLTAVQAAARIGQARVRGAGGSPHLSPGERELTFEPGTVQPGEYRFSIGSAGSATLVLQTVLLPLVVGATSPSGGTTRVVVEGGTHNPLAPPFDFLEKAYIPLLNRMGAAVTAHLERYGFYPAGEGRIVVTVQPTGPLRPLHLPERGEIVDMRARAVVANLPVHIARRELKVIAGEMGLAPGQLEIREIRRAPGPGNVVTLEVVAEQVTEVFTGFGRKGLPAEKVAGGVVAAARRYLEAEVAVGEHLADQLLLPLAVAGEGSFSTLPLTPHAETNIHVIRQFLDLEIEVAGTGGRRLVKMWQKSSLYI
ncbi:MAG: RNA 3'-terminal phosphate cyclase [Calditrichaeota bacterium]|nr:MAG: RNA 3'-terminal phosphate cyclase [Calditrichota bacterium]